MFGVRYGSWPRLLAGALVVSVGCAPGALQGPRTAVSEPLVFRFETEEGAIRSESLAGRVTVITFLTTYDVASQLAVQRVDRALRGADRRANGLGVVMEAPRYGVLLPTYRETLGLSFPLILADHAVLNGRGPWGELTTLPVVIVLTPRLQEFARFVGPASLSDISAAINAAASR